MSKTISRLLLSTCALGALAVPAYAQESEETALRQGEIVVTARRAEESLQDAPLAVSAFSEQALQDVSAENLGAIQGLVPNVNIVQGRGSNSSANIFIRGVGQPDALQTFDPAVGVYVDDVYLSRIRGALVDLFDLERVEVLRGPQGTLYGKNTIGGALKLVTRKPSLSGTDFDAELTVGDYSYGEGKIRWSAPLVEDKVGFSVSGLVSKREGFVKDPLFSGREYNDKDTVAGRIGLRFKQDDVFELNLQVDHTEESPSLTVGQATSPLFSLDLSNFAPTIRFLPTGAEFDYRTSTTPTLPNESELTHTGASATAVYTPNDAWTFKSVTAARDLDHEDYIDIDATPLELGDVFVGVDQDQYSQEFQVNYDAGGRFSFVGGVFGMVEEIESLQFAFADDFLTFFGFPLAFTREIGDDLTTTSFALYGEGRYDVTDRLSAALGLRYTHEEKDYSRYTFTSLAPTPFSFSVTDSWEDVSPALTLDYDLTDDAMLYARYAQGYKSGGFNGRANNPGEQQPYDPEKVNSYEAGLKTSWMGGRLVANTAVFYNDYEDFQARVSQTVDNPTPGQPPVIALTVLNAGALEIWGWEFEGAWLPTDALTLTATLGYLNAEYGEFNDLRAPGGDRSGQTPAFSPEWTGRLAGKYVFDLGEMGDLALNADASYRSEMALAVDNANLVTGVRFPGMWSEDYWLYNANLTWSLGSWRAVLWGKNLSDEVYRTDAQEFSSVGGIQTVYYGAPRTFGVTVGYSY